MREDITIVRASVDDAEEVLGVIRRAFGPVAEQYGDPELPPLVETLDSHRKRYETSVVLKALDADGRIVGTVQGESRDDGCCYVARLAVDPARQGTGIGRTLTEALEAEFPEASRFELFTGHKSEGSLGLYRSLGYRETRRECVNDDLTLVWMEKVRRQRRT